MLFALHVGDLTQSSNVPKGNRQAEADHLHTGTLPQVHTLATLPLASKISNNYSNSHQFIII